MNRNAFCVIFGFILILAACSNDSGTGLTIVPPSIASVAPNEVSRGQRGTGSIRGSNFTGITAVSLGADVAVSAFRAMSSTLIEFDFIVNQNAASGARTVTVAGTNGTGTLAGGLRVNSNRAPIPRFTISPDRGARNTTFTFDALSSDDPDGFLRRFEWDFGDDQTATGPVVQHRFPRTGSYVITLTLTDDEDGVNILAKEMAVVEGKAPIPRFVIRPQEGDVNTTFVFDASNSRDDDGRITQYIWKIGNTSFEGQVVEHLFKFSGTFNVVLTVIDNDGLENALTRELQIKDFDQDKAIAEIQSVTLEFFRRYSQLETMPAEEIVVNWSEAPDCRGRDREISIIERQKLQILETNAEVIGDVVVSFDSSTRAHALAAALFEWTEIDNSEHEGEATHDFLFRLEDGRWQICNFSVFTGTLELQKLFSE